MTQNQIAYAANQESIRHNQATEEISKQTNDIQSERNRFDYEYKQRMLDLQDRYNTLSLQLQEAQGNRKLDIQQELSWLEFQKANIDKEYKANMATIAERDSRTRANLAVETERYQKALNDLGFSKLEIDTQLANIKQKQLEYDKYFQDQEVRIQDFNALINKQKTEYDYSLGLIREENQQVRNELTAELQEYQKATMFTNSVWEGIGTLLRSLK